jgi:hypothetical protein
MTLTTVVSPTHLTPARVIRICQVLIGFHMVVRAIVFGSAFFYGDDYIMQSRAARFPLLSDTFLLYEHNGHLMPGGFLLTGIAESIAPLNYWPMLAIILVLQFIATWATYRLVRALIGARPALLVPVALITLTPLTLLPGAWYAAAINLLPLQIAAAFTGLFVLKGLRASKVWFIPAATSLVGGLLFFEKSLFIPVVALAVAVAAGGPGGSTVRLTWKAFTRLWLYWVLTVPIVVIYLLLYSAVSESEFVSLFDSSRVVVIVSTTVIEGLIPTLIGGPLLWLAVGAGGAIAAPPVIVTVTAAIIVGIVVLIGLVGSPRSRAVWLLAGLYLLLDLIVMVIGRAALAPTEDIGLGLRYVADSLVIIAVALAITIAPPIHQKMSRRERQLRNAVRRGMQRTWAPIVVGVGVVALLTVALTSHVRLVEPLVANESRPWLTNVRDTLRAEPVPLQLLETKAPDFVLPPFAEPYSDLSWVLAPFGDEVEFVTQLDRGVLLDRQGRLSAAAIEGSNSRTGPNGECGWGVTDAPVSISLDNTPFYWFYQAKLEYFTSGDVDLNVQFGEGPPVPLSVTEGIGTVWFNIEGGGSALTVTPVEGSAPICVVSAQVGAMVPTPGVIPGR